MNEAYYGIVSVSYCFPFCTTQWLLNRFGDINTDMVNMGVLKKYIGVQMTREEADELLCTIIKRHPFIPHAMELEVEIDRIVADSSFETYQTLTIRRDCDNDHYGLSCSRRNVTPKILPIKWENKK